MNDLTGSYLVFVLGAGICVGLAACGPMRGTRDSGTMSAPLPYGALPTPAQLVWHEREFYAFVHFNMNTFTGIEWGQGTEGPDQFNPTELDCEQWCKLFKECGAGIWRRWLTVIGSGWRWGRRSGISAWRGFRW